MSGKVVKLELTVREAEMVRIAVTEFNDKLGVFPERHGYNGYDKRSVVAALRKINFKRVTQ